MGMDRDNATVPMSAYIALVEVNDQIIATTRSMLDTADTVVELVASGATAFEEGQRLVAETAIHFAACRESLDRLAAKRPDVGPRQDA